MTVERESAQQLRQALVSKTSSYSRELMHTAIRVATPAH